MHTYMHIYIHICGGTCWYIVKIRFVLALLLREAKPVSMSNRDLKMFKNTIEFLKFCTDTDRVCVIVIVFQTIC